MFGKTKRQLATNLSPKRSVYDEVCTVGSTKCLDLQFGDRDTIAVFVAIFYSLQFCSMFVEHRTSSKKHQKTTKLTLRYSSKDKNSHHFLHGSRSDRNEDGVNFVLPYIAHVIQFQSRSRCIISMLLHTCVHSLSV